MMFKRKVGLTLKQFEALKDILLSEVSCKNSTVLTELQEIFSKDNYLDFEEMCKAFDDLEG